MTDITARLADFEQRLECNSERLSYAKTMLASLAAQLPDPSADNVDVLRRMDVWIGNFEKAVIERTDLIDELEDMRRESRAAVARATAALLGDGEQAHA